MKHTLVMLALWLQNRRHFQILSFWIFPPFSMYNGRTSMLFKEVLGSWNYKIKYISELCKNWCLKQKGGELFVKDFRKDWLRMNLYQTITHKKLRKAIKQWYKNYFQNFNWLKSHFNRLFISATKAELKQTVIRS